MAKKELTFKVGAEITEFETKMAQVSSKMQDFGSKMKKVGKDLTLYVTTPFLALGGAMAKAAMDLEAAGAKYNTVFKGMIKQSDAFIKEFKKLTPATTAQARNMASGIQDLLVPMGFMRSEATNITGELFHVIGALTNFNSGTHRAEDVVRAVQSALTGMYQPLKNLGIQLDETTIKNKALELGLVNSGKEITKQIRVQVLLKELYAQSGDALDAYTKENLDAKTSLGLLRADLVDLGVQFGNIILPKIITIIAKMREWVEVLSKLDPATKKIIMVVGGLAAVIGPLLITLGILVKTIIPALITGGHMVAAAWWPLVVISAAVTGAIYLLNRDARKLNALIEELDKQTTKQLRSELEQLRDDVGKKTTTEIEGLKNELKELREQLKNTEGTGARIAILLKMKEATDKLASAQRILAKTDDKETKEKYNRIDAIQQILKARQDEIDVNEKLQALLKSLTEAEKEQLGVVGLLMEKIGELQDNMKFANTAEDVYRLNQELRATKKELNDILLAAREIETRREWGDIPKRIDTQTIEQLEYQIDPLEDQAKRTRDTIINLSKTFSDLMHISDTVSLKIIQSFEFLGRQIIESKKVIIELGKELQYLATDVVISLADSLGRAFSGGTFKNGLDNLLLTIANWAQQFGAILIAAAIASEAFQKTLFANPLTALVAGVALVAAAGAVKGALESRPGASGASGASYGGGGSGKTVEGLRNLQEFNLKLSGELVAKGNDLVTVFDRENVRRGL